MDNPKSNPSESDDRIWELLNESAPAKAGSFFSRNVVREVRILAEKQHSSGGLLAWFRSPIASLAGAAAAIVILALVLSPSGNDAGVVTNDSIPAEEFNPAEEFVDVDYLGQLMAVADPAELDDRAFSELF